MYQFDTSVNPHDLLVVLHVGILPAECREVLGSLQGEFLSLA